MNIPKSYEALAADLASEKILSKTLFGQKESYMMLADGRKFDLDALQQRLAVAEQQSREMSVAISSVIKAVVFHRGVVEIDTNSYHALEDALKPAADGEGS